jgi:hypothetical protein
VDRFHCWMLSRYAFYAPHIYPLYKQILTNSENRGQHNSKLSRQSGERSTLSENTPTLRDAGNPTLWEAVYALRPQSVVCQRHPIGVLTRKLYRHSDLHLTRARSQLLLVRLSRPRTRTGARSTCTTWRAWADEVLRGSYWFPRPRVGPAHDEPAQMPGLASGQCAGVQGLLPCSRQAEEHSPVVWAWHAGRAARLLSARQRLSFLAKQHDPQTAAHPRIVWVHPSATEYWRWPPRASLAASHFRGWFAAGQAGG